MNTDYYAYKLKNIVHTNLPSPHNQKPLSAPMLSSPTMKKEKDRHADSTLRKKEGLASVEKNRESPNRKMDGMSLNLPASSKKDLKRRGSFINSLAKEIGIKDNESKQEAEKLLMEELMKLREAPIDALKA
jgi:hypothetical protein